MSWGLTINDIGGDVKIVSERDASMPPSLEELLKSNRHLALVENGVEVKPKPRKATGVPSELEMEFVSLWKALSGPSLIREHQFHPSRKWRFDFAYLDRQIAIEIEGGIWGNGRHNRAAGFIRDCIKYNQAALNGWTVFRLATGMITEEHLKPIIDKCI